MPSEPAPAKINLALHVRRRRADGYHDIDTLFAFAEDGDVLHATPADDLSLTITGPCAGALSAGEDNLVLRAARLLGERAERVATLAFTLDKRLPVASGIGGGSADAAATLRLLCRHWGIDPAEPMVAACAQTLGADVPACLDGHAAIGTGKGDDLRRVSLGDLAGRPLLLANPGTPVATGGVFAAWDGIDRGPLPGNDAGAIAARGRNDLTAAAIALAPAIAPLLEALDALPGATLARMSGSGATCFALFDDVGARDAGAAAIARRLPGCWQLPTRLAG